MERNWETIRDILLKLEATPPEQGAVRLSDFPAERAHEYSYHAELLMEAGLVYGQMSQSMGRGPQDFIAQRLTWNGHEFLDAIRDDTVWNRTKTSFKESGISMTFDLVQRVATDIAAAYVRSVTGG